MLEMVFSGHTESLPRLSSLHQPPSIHTNTILRKVTNTSTPKDITTSCTRIPLDSTAMLTSSEEEREKERVAALTPFQRELELRELDDRLARLHVLRGINNGELYTLRGKFKALARDYGLGFMAWYWTLWTSTALLTYTGITMGGVDAIAILAKVDFYTGLDMSQKVDPTLGTVALTLAVNECLEPLRLPIVVLTTKPVVNFFTQSNRRG